MVILVVILDQMKKIVVWNFVNKNQYAWMLEIVARSSYTAIFVCPV